MKFAILAIILMVYLISITSAEFLSGCQKVTVSRAMFIRAYCKMDNGKYDWTETNLDLCLTNNNGQLGWQPGGGAQGSCRELDYQGGVLFAQCRTMDGSWDETDIDLNEGGYLSNHNAYLACKWE